MRLLSNIQFYFENPSHLYYELETKIINGIRQIRYIIKVPNKDHNESTEAAKNFSEEFLGFINNIYPLGLKKISPNNSQLNNINTILKSAVAGELLINNSSKIYKNIPELCILYNPTLEIIEREKNPYIFSTVNIDVNNKFPIRYLISGMSPKNPSKAIEFRFTDKKPTCDEDLEDIIHGFPDDTENNVYENGERIIMTCEIDLRGIRYKETSKYYLIGNFKSDSLEKDFYIYAHNHENGSNIRSFEGVNVYDKQFYFENNQ